MLRYTFNVNRVDDSGKHERQDDKTITVDAPTEEIARSIARGKLKDWSPGVQRFHPAELVSPPCTVVPPPPDTPMSKQNKGPAIAPDLPPSEETHGPAFAPRTPIK